ncbi:MAG: hypothetical protein KDA54_09835 [Phycisphaerales bacterium]|nr:hypothetical protein [Phycisphaerales bacterium]
MNRSVSKLALLIVAMPCGQVIAENFIYVDASASQSPHNGSDWDHACLRLEDAMLVAGPGTVIRMAAGTYMPDTAGQSDPRDATFTVTSGVILEGGYAGSSAINPNSRDVSAFETVLSGDIGLAGVDSDNCYHVLRANGASAQTIIDGVTITGGNANGSGAGGVGGGIVVIAGAPTIRDCRILENAAEYGGGIFNDGGELTIERVTFEANVATASGGALYNNAVFDAPGVSVTDCLFDDNSAFSNGGAVRNWDSTATFLTCTFTANHIRYGGAAVANGGQGVQQFVRCAFESNRADTLFAANNCYGGAMHSTDNTEQVLQSSLFKGNRAIASLPGLSHGGAIATSDNAELTVINCTLVDNNANFGNGLYAEDQSDVTLRNTVVWDGGNEIVNVGAATVAATYSIVTGGISGSGNLADDPLLVDGHPQAGSPCINGGDPGFVSPVDRDLDGHARVLCGQTDIGAFEFGIGDYNCDESVTLADYANWSDCMTGPDAGPYLTGCSAFDYEFDADVDMIDFAGLMMILGE